MMLFCQKQQQSSTAKSRKTHTNVNQRKSKRSQRKSKRSEKGANGEPEGSQNVISGSLKKELLAQGRDTYNHHDYLCGRLLFGLPSQPPTPLEPRGSWFKNGILPGSRSRIQAQPLMLPSVKHIERTRFQRLKGSSHFGSS